MLVFEAALLPGLVLGIATMLVPKHLSKLGAAVSPLVRSTVRGAYALGKRRKRWSPRFRNTSTTSSPKSMQKATESRLPRIPMVNRALRRASRRRGNSRRMHAKAAHIRRMASLSLANTAEGMMGRWPADES